MNDLGANTAYKIKEQGVVSISGFSTYIEVECLGFSDEFILTKPSSS